MDDLEGGGGGWLGAGGDPEPKASDRVRILLIGDAGVGKTTLSHLLCRGTVPKGLPRTVGCRADVRLHRFRGAPFFVELVEIDGSERFRAVRPTLFLQHFDGVIFVHDVSNRNSRRNMPQWRAEVQEARSRLEAEEGIGMGAPSSRRLSGERRPGSAGGGGLEESVDAGDLVRVCAGAQGHGPSLKPAPHSPPPPSQGQVPCFTVGTKRDLARQGDWGRDEREFSLIGPSARPTAVLEALQPFLQRVIERSLQGERGHQLSRVQDLYHMQAG